MARYNTSSTTNTITGTATISSPFQGAFTQFTGTAPYTVTLPAPAAFPGINQTYYNSTGGLVTISTPSGNFTGTGGPSASTFVLNSGNVVSVVPDGTNYIVLSEDGSPLVATTGSFSSNVSITGGATSITPSSFSLNPGGSGSNIDNVNIGLTTRSTGAFTTLAANAAVTFTANTSSSSSSTGTLVVTGGIGVSGNLNAGGNVSATNLAGTLTTASQPNITSHGTLTSLTVAGTTSLTGAFSVKSSVAADQTWRLEPSTNAWGSKLLISSASSGDGGIRYGQGGGNDLDIFAYGSTIFRNSTSNISGTVTTAEVMRITNAGNVGIGTTDPQTKLHIGNYQSDVAITLANLQNSTSRINFYDNNNTEGTYLKATGESYGGTISLGARWDDDEDKMVLKMYQVSAGGAYHIRAGVGNTAPEGTLHVTASAITAAAPSVAWPNYINPDQDTNARVVAIFDTSGNSSIATAGYGPTVVLRLGAYYDSRAVISPIGAGGASPSDQGTNRGKDLMVKGGQSDNTNGATGGRLFLNGGAGYSGSFGANGYYGNVEIQRAGGNTVIGKNDAYGAGYNNLYMPFKYNDTGEWAPMKGNGWIHIGSFTHRAGNRYLDIKTNNNSGSLMFMFHIYGYLYNSANINTYIGGYSYTNNSILNLYTQNLANCTATAYRTSTNNYLCLKLDRNNNGYSEGKVNVFFHAWSQGEMENLVVTSYAQNDSASNYYTS